MNLKELATALGLSQATVSRAINGYPEVAEKARQLVLEAAKTTGYRPDPTARRLATGATRAIGVVLPSLDVDASATSHFLSSLVAIAWHAGYRVELLPAPREGLWDPSIKCLDRYLQALIWIRPAAAVAISIASWDVSHVNVLLDPALECAELDAGSSCDAAPIEAEPDVARDVFEVVCGLADKQKTVPIAVTIWSSARMRFQQMKPQAYRQTSRN